MTTIVHLKVVQPEESDSRYVWSGEEGEPVFEGAEPDQSLACGACDIVLARSISKAALAERFDVPGRLTIRCACGATNLVFAADARG